MRNLITLAFVSSLFVGCYSSHTRPNAFVEPPPAPMCAAESSDPIARYDVLAADDVVVEAGTRRVSLMSIHLQELSHGDIEFAEYLYRFTALAGSLTAPDGGAVFTNARLTVSDRVTRFGPDDIIATGEEVVDGEFWDARILRADDEVTITLEVDIAEGAEGIFEVRLGDDCDLTPRMRFAPDGAIPVEIPLNRIGGNEPITVRVRVIPATGCRPL